MANRIINPNLSFLVRSLKEGKRGVILSGSSRSGKTFSSLDFIVYLCSKVETGATINIIKETYNSFKTTLYDDFNRRLPDYGLVSPFASRQEVKTFKLFGNKINLLGADDSSKFHGASCDYFYINEALDVSQEIFNQSEMRCRKFWWMDFNPKYSDHWIFDKVQNRDNVGFLKTTFKDNPFVSNEERTKILSYEPTEFNTYQGTADEYMWDVYGLGLRSSPEGLVFKNVTWIDKFPTNIEKVYYGLDLGYTISPTSLSRLGVEGNNLYCEVLHYEPTENSNVLIPMLRQKATDATIWCDSADPGMISDCRKAGLRVLAVNKFAGSIKYGISLMKKYKIHVVESQAAKKEFNNYKYKTIQGIQLDEPEDDNNHFIDSCRYSAMSNLR